MQINNKKPLPWFPTKSQVYRIFVKVNPEAVKEEMCNIMMKHRNETEEKVKNKRTLYHPEFVRLIRMFGIPQGYHAPDGFFEEPG